MTEKRSQVRPRTGGHVTIEQMAAEDGRYHPQAFDFVYKALEHKLRQLGERRHLSRDLTAEELLDGLRQLALERFGLLARTVLEQWGISRTEDVGEMVYLLIEHGLLFKTEKDSKEEFKDVFDFRQAFDDSYQVPARL